jgi:hypothetical protein
MRPNTGKRSRTPVARLEEIGDLIDGEPPTAAEIQMLLKRLEA